MNKLLILFTFVTLTTTSWSQKGIYIAGYTRFETGYPHAGSYGKERPSFALEQSFATPVSNKFSFGLGTGIALYPGAYTIPAFALAAYRIHFRDRYVTWTNRIGVNLKVGENAFFGYRYNSSLHYNLRITRRLTGYAGIGGNYLWDRWGGKSLSGTISIGIIYKVFNGKSSNPKKGPPERYKSTPWF